jgi:hypothetical protein
MQGGAGLGDPAPKGVHTGRRSPTMTCDSGCHDSVGGGIHGGEVWARAAGHDWQRLGQEGLTGGPNMRVASLMVGHDWRAGAVG